MAIKRSKPLRRSRVKRVSSKAAARNEVRAELTQQWLAESADENPLGYWPVCEIQWGREICQGVATHAHEPRMRSRAGADIILDRKECLLTCWPCHRTVHAQVAEATRRGFLVPSWNA
jgi:hypothetical protein